MIDYDFEDRLVERIYLRELIASVDLSAKAKRVLRYRLRGHTLAEVGRDESLSRERIREIFKHSVRKIQHKLRAVEAGFDKAAFLHHMQGLAGKQAEREQQQFEYERAKLEWMLRKEREPDPPKPPPQPPAISGWLVERLLGSGEFYQVFNYLKSGAEITPFDPDTDEPRSMKEAVIKALRDAPRS